MYYFQVLRRSIEQAFKKDKIPTENTEFLLENFNIIFNLFNACLIYYNESTNESLIHHDYTELTKSLVCICNNHIFDILNQDIKDLFNIDDRYFQVKELCHSFQKLIPQSLPRIENIDKWKAADFEENYFPSEELSSMKKKLSPRSQFSASSSDSSNNCPVFTFIQGTNNSSTSESSTFNSNKVIFVRK